MGKKLIAKLLPQLKKMRWPQNPSSTELGRKAYDTGLDKVDTYNDDPKVLGEALRIFQTGDSQPYAYAGVAYALLAASKEKDGSHAPEGLEATMEWLEMAQESEPDIVDINMIESLVYIYSERFEDARLVLNYLHDQDRNNYYLHVAEIIFWQKLEDMEQAAHWYEKASLSAKTVPQRLRLLSKMGNFYMQMKAYDNALQMFKEALHFNKTDAWLWHHISVIYWRQENYEEAARYNKQALKIDELPVARQMEAALKKKLSGTGLLGRFRKG